MRVCREVLTLGDWTIGGWAIAVKPAFAVKYFLE
jgi:hypothetical protein